MRFTLGAMTVHARVIEDRGHIGLGGRQLIRVEVLGEDDEDEPRRFEVPSADVVLEQPAAK